MSEYSYRPELKKNRPMYNIDFSKPAVAPLIKTMVKELRRASASYAAPEGVRCSVFCVNSRDKQPVTCFVVEPENDGILPGMLYCHGGGFFLPLQTSQLQLAACYAQKLQIRIFLPEYRILPEYSHPYPLYDCWAVWEYMQQAQNLNIDKDRLLLYGESAGGALTAGIARRIRDTESGHARGQLLIYPVLDDRTDRYPSMELYKAAPWSKSSTLYMWREYLRDRYAELEKYAVPMRNNEFSNLPEAYIEPQEIDVLRDEAVAYAYKLRKAGVPVSLNIIYGSYHGFDADVENPFVRQIITQRIQSMAEMLKNSSSTVK